MKPIRNSVNSSTSSRLRLPACNKKSCKCSPPIIPGLSPSPPGHDLDTTTNCNGSSDYSHSPFPLTPALSLRERVEHLQRSRRPGTLVFQGLTNGSPSPLGRGPG